MTTHSKDRDFVRGADRRDGRPAGVPLRPQQSRMRRSRGSGEPSRSSCREPPAGTFKPDATLAIFHGRHYSRVEVHAEQPRPLLGNPADASADQLRAVWGPFVAEAGTFEVSGNDVITMHATVAKNPAAMQDGASSVYTYRREGDTLTLTEVRTPAGPSAQPITVTLTRVE